MRAGPSVIKGCSVAVLKVAQASVHRAGTRYSCVCRPQVPSASASCLRRCGRIMRSSMQKLALMLVSVSCWPGSAMLHNGGSALHVHAGARDQNMA